MFRFEVCVSTDFELLFFIEFDNYQDAENEYYKIVEEYRTDNYYIGSRNENDAINIRLFRTQDGCHESAIKSDCFWKK